MTQHPLSRAAEEFIAWWEGLSPDEKRARRQVAREFHGKWMIARRRVLFGLRENTGMEQAVEQLDIAIEELNAIRTTGDRLVFLASMTEELESLRERVVHETVEATESDILGMVARARLFM